MNFQNGIYRISTVFLSLNFNSMQIRKARPQDASSIAVLLLLAMEDIVYEFIGEKSYSKAIEFLKAMVTQRQNQYSYENCWVAETKEGIIAVACLYDGSRLQELRKPVAHYIKEHFAQEFNPEDETQAGEVYIDCVGVHPNQQGKGIGSKIFAFLIDQYVIKQKQILGLLVDYDNPKAEKLYLKLGFEIIGEKTLVGKRLKHLQYRP